MMEMTFKYTLDNVSFLHVVCILFKHVQTLNLIFLNSVFLVKFEYTLLHLKFYFNFSKSEVINDIRAYHFKLNMNTKRVQFRKNTLFSRPFQLKLFEKL